MYRDRLARRAQTVSKWNASRRSPLHGKTSDCRKITGILRHELSEDRIIPVKIGLDESQLVSAQIRISLHRRTHGKHKTSNLGTAGVRVALNENESQEVRCFLAGRLGRWICNCCSITYFGSRRRSCYLNLAIKPLTATQLAQRATTERIANARPAAHEY